MELIEEIKELKEYKEDKNLPIAELARRIEADDTTVGRWLKVELHLPAILCTKYEDFLNSIKGWEGSKPLGSFKDKVIREREQTKKDINYLKQRIKDLNDIEDLDALVTELNVITQLGNLVRDAHKAPF